MKKMIAVALCMVMMLSMSASFAFAAKGVSDFSDEDYMTLEYSDYRYLRTFSDRGHGVSWPAGAQVIYGESDYWQDTSVKDPAGYNFKADTSVTSVEFPESVVILGMYALSGRSEVTAVNFTKLKNLKYIDSMAFKDVKLSTVDLRNTKVININDGAFPTVNYPTLTTFMAPSTLRRIGDTAFEGQRNLSVIKLNEGLEYIGKEAFASCSANNIVIPSTVTHIGSGGLRADRAYQVYPGSYGEEWCKSVKASYTYVNGSPAGNSGAAGTTPGTGSSKTVAVQTKKSYLNPNSTTSEFSFTFNGYIEKQQTYLDSDLPMNIGPMRYNVISKVSLEPGGSITCNFDNAGIRLIDYPTSNLADFENHTRRDNPPDQYIVTDHAKIAAKGIVAENAVVSGMETVSTSWQMVMPDITKRPLYRSGYTWKFNKPGTYGIDAGQGDHGYVHLVVVVEGEGEAPGADPNLNKALPALAESKTISFFSDMSPDLATRPTVVPVTFSNYVSDDFSQNGSTVVYSNVTIRTGGVVRCDFTRCGIKYNSSYNPGNTPESQIALGDYTSILTSAQEVAPYGIVVSNAVELEKEKDPYVPGGYSKNGVYGKGLTWQFTKPGTYFISVGTADSRFQMVKLTVTGAGSAAAANASGFSDVPDSAWYAGDVTDVKDLGIISGKGNGRFDPEGNLTVGEAVTLAAKTRARQNGASIPAASGEWYMGAVNYAISQGVMKSGDFTDYERNATRAEMAYLFAGALPESEYAAVNSIAKLPDVTSATKHQEAIFKLYNAGIVSGSDKQGTFKPADAVSRAEAAAILNRVVNADKRSKLTLE